MSDEVGDQSTLVDLQINGIASPQNLDTRPVFSWIIKSSKYNQKQNAYQIQVINQDRELVWDSLWVQSSQQNNILYNGAVLKPSQAYSWRVRAKLNNKVLSWSNWQSFNTGLRDADWQPAKWLGRTLTTDDQKNNVWSLFRHVANLNSNPIKHAMAYIAAIHTFKFWVNVQLVDSGFSYGYPGEGFYQGVSIQQELQSGQENCFGFLTHYEGPGQGRAPQQPGLLVKIVIDYQDGHRQVINSDDTWQVHKGPFFQAGMRNGENDYIEAQDGPESLALSGWSTTNYDADDWDRALNLGVHPNSVWTHLSGLPVRLSHQIINAQSIKELDDGSQLIDFVQIYPASPMVHFHNGKSGRKINILAGYRLNKEGHIDTSKLAAQSTNMSFPYVEVNGDQQYVANTHLAYRYLEIRGSQEHLKLTDVQSVVVHRQWPCQLAKFQSDSDILNQVWHLLKHSTVNGVQETYVDTPTREKGQFLVDAANVSYATMLLTGETADSRLALQEFINSQHRYWTVGDDCGRYNAVYPNGDGKRDIPDYTELYPDWSWQYFRHSGDAIFMANIYPELHATAEYILRHIDHNGGAFDGLVVKLAGGRPGGPYDCGIVDWPVHSRFDYDMDTVVRTTVNMLAVNNLQRTFQVAKLAGAPQEEVKQLYLAMQNLIRAINKKLRNEDGLYVDGLKADGTQSSHISQHANSYAIAFNVAPEEDRTFLVQWIARQGMKQGPMTVHWLTKALGQMSANDDLLKLFTNQNDFGWAQWLKKGGTFTPECWLLSGNANSESHGWGVQPVVDLINYLGGIRVVDIREGHFKIVVPVISGVYHVKTTIPTIMGPVSVNWQKEDSEIKLNVNLPANTKAEIVMPDYGHLSGSSLSLIESFTRRNNQLHIKVGSGNWHVSTNLN